MPTAADIAAALRLQPAGRGCWRGACPICGGSRRFQLREGDKAPLWYCFAGCSGAEIAAELRRRGLLPERELTPEDRRRMAEERRRREEAAAFAGAAQMLADHALEGMPSTDPRRGDLTQLRLALQRSPEAEATWWKQNRPEMFRAMVAAWARQQQRWRRRAARLLAAAEVMP